MPRPGPRPYECVRRAWHSDRHQPIRGSLIQDIFRLVNEAHGSTTKKNKEWQEKLPVVVLKAEEIMYSKANSEAEYMEPKTLWDRTNDAINTIIRRDESMETGELLQPCIEAALNLGCTPRRASRSQRNCNPSFYLSPITREPNTLLPGSMHSATQADHASNSHVLPNYPNMVKPMIMNSTPSGSESQDFAGQINGASNKFLFIDDNIPLHYVNQCLPLENYRVPSPCSVYPLYYGGCLEPRRGGGALPKTVPGTMEPVEVAAMQNFFPRTEDIPVQTCHADHRKDSPLQQQETGMRSIFEAGLSPSSSAESDNYQATH
ncbi:HISTONE ACETYLTRANSFERASE [Salix viminalis]|uniref:HISTONE ACETYLTRANSFERASE n=1 Tax=Salix viminalis TaxID=40686 RepID=A0A9Q0ZR58_SALVM|nr:HISTONE ACETYLTRANSFERASE [Salix viminalis]